MADVTSIPPDVVVEDVLPHLQVGDLLALRLVSKYCKALVDDEIIWRRRIAEDFNFPAHASARVTGWQQLYRGLSRPNVFVWGQAANCRLGIAPRELDEKVRVLVSNHDGAPFPLKVDYKQATSSGAGSGMDVGAPVRMIAGGWSFHVLTSRGDILYWGTLDGDVWSVGNDLTDPHVRIQTPSLLTRPTPEPVRLLAGGRKHAVALTSEQRILEWHSWDTAVQHEPLVQTTRSENQLSVLQLEAGWDFTVALLGSVQHTTRGQSWGSGQRKATTELVYWHYDWVARKEEVGGRPTWVGVRTITLPALPSPSEQVSQEIEAVETSDNQTVAQVAAGEDFVIVLTVSGLIYKLDVSPVAHIVPRDEQEQPGTHPATSLARAFAHGDRAWRLMEHFCLPSRIASLSSFSNDERLANLVGARTRIAHVSAQFRTWAAYSTVQLPTQEQPKTAEHSDDSGIVLLGKSDNVEESGPTVKPELQGIGVIKVSSGDWHHGALTASGRVLTWGQWSKGALGTWDSLPDSTAGAQQQGVPPLLRHRGIRIGLAGAHPHRGVGGGGRLVPQPVQFERDDADSDASTTQRPTSASAGGAGSAQPVQDPWLRRVQHRQMPSTGVDIPTRVCFDPQNSERDFAFDITFAGWHSAALTVETSLVEPKPEVVERPDASIATQTEEVSTVTGGPLWPSSSQQRIVHPNSGETAGHSQLTGDRGPTSSRQEYMPSSFDLDTEIREALRREHRAQQVHRLSLAFLCIGLFICFGGWEDWALPSLLYGSSNEAPTGVGVDGPPSYLEWPQSLAYFGLLAIPLVLYITIARWTGSQIWTHS
ncbi:unnamed protein product [Parajaminaea phylloscopi]